jgi:hypothetical protein
MKRFVFVITLIAFASSLFAQAPLVKQWDFRYGGKGSEKLTAAVATPDSGLIMGGWSLSGMDNDKSEPSQGGLDYWVVKIDKAGNKQWDKRYGGTANDGLTAVQFTSDGGYILGGTSASGISGDKTVPAWGGGDFWVIKTDSAGNKQWDNRYGGTEGDMLNSMEQTFDGGYIFGGWTHSDSSGDKTQHTWGHTDYWIIKTDSSGVPEWNRRFGGTEYESMFCLKKSNDGGYILGGFTDSDSSGDKTEHSRGSYDYWIVKTNGSGDLLWEKTFGGSSTDELYALEQLNGEGYILAGLSKSPVSGDKSEPNWNSTGGFEDFWIVRIDTLGNKLWDKDFGGIQSEDDIGNIITTADNGFLITGTSYSNISGNKTETNLGTEQVWMVKTDAIGNLEWDKTIFNLPLPDDEFGMTIRTLDGCYVMANYSNSGIAGYKSQDCHDSLSNLFGDYWIIKLCDTTAVTSISGIHNKANIFAYPNPVHTILTIPAKSDQLILIYNSSGSLIYNRKHKLSSNNTFEINVKDFSSGNYFVKTAEEWYRFVKE